jgi:hypothetical protein
MKSSIPYKTPQKTTVYQELEYWNAIHVYTRLKIYYRERLRTKTKGLQGLESSDFAMAVLESIIAEDVSWQRSTRSCFLDFVYDTARGYLSNFIRDNKERKFISYDVYVDALPDNRIQDNFNGF